MNLNKFLGFLNKILDLSLDKLIGLIPSSITLLFLTLIAITAGTLDDPVVIALGWVVQLSYLVSLLINHTLLLTTLLLLAIIAIWTNTLNNLVIIILGWIVQWL